MRAEKMLPSLGWMEFHIHHDLGAALRLYGISSHLPHDPWVTRCRVMLSLSRQRFDEGIELLKGAIRQDPYSPWLQARLAWALHLKGEAAASVDQIRRTLEMFPDQDPTELYGALILAYNGEARQAVEIASNLTRRLPYFDLATAIHAYALAAAGERDEARQILERLQWLSHERFVISSLTPAVWVALGDKEAALASLRTAEKARCPWFFQMLADPRLKPLEDTEEWQRMRRMLAQMEDDTDYD
jgi:tetratricopeptide (TPR) repeat protein